MTEPLTPLDVVRQLSQLARELDLTTDMLRDADHDAALKRHAADMAESRAFVGADGSMDLRKHLARLAADPLEQEALVAEALVRHLRARIRALDTRIEVGRSMGTTLRAEMALIPYVGEGS